MRNWDEKKIEQLLREMPHFKDQRPAEEIYETINECLHSQNKKTPFTWISTISSAAILFLLLSVIATFQKSSNTMVDQYSTTANLEMKTNSPNQEMANILPLNAIFSTKVPEAIPNHYLPAPNQIIELNNKVVISDDHEYNGINEQLYPFQTKTIDGHFIVLMKEGHSYIPLFVMTPRSKKIANVRFYNTLLLNDKSPKGIQQLIEAIIFTAKNKGYEAVQFQNVTPKRWRTYNFYHPVYDFDNQQSLLTSEIIGQ